jgi:hypothetical protein
MGYRTSVYGWRHGYSGLQAVTQMEKKGLATVIVVSGFFEPDARR